MPRRLLKTSRQRLVGPRSPPEARAPHQQERDHEQHHLARWSGGHRRCDIELLRSAI